MFRKLASSRSSRKPVAAIVALVATVGVSGSLTDASAAALPPGCSESGPIVSCTQAFTSGSNPFTVPAGVNSIHVVAVGGAGAASPNALGGVGGAGALVSGVLPVTSRATWWALVGGNASGTTGGSNGGGNGFLLPASRCGSPCPGGIPGGGGGGGASDVRSSQSDLMTRLLVAAGGGGGGLPGVLLSPCTGASPCVNGFARTSVADGGAGGDAAMAGGSGSDTSLACPPRFPDCGNPTLTGSGGGGAGTAAMGGSPGPGGCSIGGGLGFGGTALFGCPGGGGGGGLFGGGVGGSGEVENFPIGSIGFLGAGSGGGGGGSDLVPPGGSQSVGTTGVPIVQISYKLIPSAKAQCQNGGWRNYPQFKNQGDCVSFVETGR